MRPPYTTRAGMDGVPISPCEVLWARVRLGFVCPSIYLPIFLSIYMLVVNDLGGVDAPRGGRPLHTPLPRPPD